ncbi:hypothetical protein D9M71_230850 [compost metagenome]
MQGAEPGEVLFGAEQVFDTGGMADPQENFRQLVALFNQRFTVEANLPGSRAHEPGQQAQQAGFAAAIGAADLQHVACSQVQFEVFEQHSPVALAGQAHGFEMRGHSFALCLGCLSQVGPGAAVILAVQIQPGRSDRERSGGIIHVMSYCKEGYFNRLPADDRRN